MPDNQWRLAVKRRQGFIAASGGRGAGHRRRTCHADLEEHGHERESQHTDKHWRGDEHVQTTAHGVLLWGCNSSTVSVKRFAVRTPPCDPGTGRPVRFGSPFSETLCPSIARPIMPRYFFLS